MDTTSAEQLSAIGSNPGHIKHLDTVSILAKKRYYKLSRVLRCITRNKNLGINRVKNLYPKSKKFTLKLNRTKTTNDVHSKFTSYDVHDNDDILAWVN